MRILKHPVRLTLSLGLVLSATAVAQSPEGFSPDPETFTLTPNPNVAIVSGNAWDPEAFFFTLAMAGGELPPITIANVPTLERSLVSGATVLLFDPLNPAGPPLVAPGPTPGNGFFEFMGVGHRPGPPYFTIATHDIADAEGGTALRPIGPPTIPMVPAAGKYLPTFTGRPIVVAWNQCVLQRAALMSDNGILEALANHLTLGGTPTTVDDLADPTKFGGVAIWWLYVPGPPVLRAPAAGTRTDADLGTAYQIDWAPPGLGPPGQSERGFFVTGAPEGGLGVTAIVLPPQPPGPPPYVSFTLVDANTGPGHPFHFPAIPPQPIAPGIFFGEVQAEIPGAPPPPAWVCAPAPH